MLIKIFHSQIRRNERKFTWCCGNSVFTTRLKFKRHAVIKMEPSLTAILIKSLFLNENLHKYLRTLKSTLCHFVTCAISVSKLHCQEFYEGKNSNIKPKVFSNLRQFIVYLHTHEFSTFLT